MKRLFLVYLILIFILVSLLTILSYGYGLGYVYIYWRHWQLQTNILGLITGFIFIGVFAHLILELVRRYRFKLQRKKERVLQLKALHPYEQFGVVWLLDAAQDQQAFMQNVFAQSGFLQDIVRAKFYYLDAEYENALTALECSPQTAFELAELQRIEIFLAQQETEKALSHLEMLYQHDTAPWLQELETAYRQKMTILWGKLALQQPWLYLRSFKYGLLNSKHRDLWLQQLLMQFDQASVDDLLNLQQRYLDLESEIQTRPFQSKVLWLKLLARMPEMSMQHETLASHLFQEKFDSDVFYLWFRQQMLKQNPDYVYIEERIQQLEGLYAQLPVLDFAKWHVYMATDRKIEAEQILSLYPDHILMSYLRIKSLLKDNEDLIKQLNLIFEKDNNFLTLGM